MSTKIPNKTLEHHFKFLGTKWKFLHSKLEQDYDHQSDYGKYKIIQEIQKLENDTIDQKVMRKMDEQICKLLNIGSTDADWTSDQGYEYDEDENEEKFNFLRREQEQVKVSGRIVPILATPATVTEPSIAISAAAGIHERTSITRDSEFNDFEFNDFDYDYDCTSNVNSAGIGKPRSLKNNRNPEPTPESPLKLSTSIPTRRPMAPNPKKNSGVGISTTTKNQNVADPGPLAGSGAGSGGVHTDNTSKRFENNHTAAAPVSASASVSVAHGPPSLSAASVGASVGFSEDSSILDAASSSSYLTEYDANYLLESVRNIKMFYSRKNLDQINAAVASTNAMDVHCDRHPNGLSSKVTAPVPQPPTTVKSSKPMNPKMSHYAPVSPRGTGSFERGNTTTNTNTNTIVSGAATNILSSSPIKIKTNTGNGNGNAGMTESIVSQSLEPNSSRTGTASRSGSGSRPSTKAKAKRYCKIDPESTPKLNIVTNPSASSSLFAYELPENRTDTEKLSVNKLLHVQHQLGSLDIGRSFKKYALDNGLRIPTCVEKEQHKKRR